MKKTNFNIATRNGIIAIPGYVFYYSGLRFGVTHCTVYNGKPEKGFSWTPWTITELTTGYAVGIGESTRKAAVDKLIESRLAARIAEFVDKYTGQDVNPDILPNTEFLTVYAE